MEDPQPPKKMKLDSEAGSDKIDESETDPLPKMEQTERGSDNESEDVAANATTDDKTGPEIKAKRPPRSERKRMKAEALKLEKKLNRAEKKKERKLRIREQRDNDGAEHEFNRIKLDPKVVRERLEEAQKSGQAICVDCSLETCMSAKEVGKLASQICRLYGSNRRTDAPAHLYLTGLQPDGLLCSELKKKMTGFGTDSCVIDYTEKVHTEMFPVETIIQLTPDSDNLLDDIDPRKVYIIGGLVDENIQKKMTLSKAITSNIATARLPIEEYMVKVMGQSSYSNVLAINQVFDILLKYIESKDWKQALAVGVPRRKGYVIADTEPT